jgi:lipopolysaccharide/colanic/teichoic acid biosynthesis glycosyltransferase
MPSKSYILAKRVFDILASSLALFCLLPLFLPLMVVLRLIGEGEVFFLQERIGFLGRKFRLIKFATMLKDSPNLGTRTITIKDDPRVLPLGHFLRKAKINELPQLINVLKGDMSIVGPRPQTEECYRYFPAKDRDKIYRVKPGLTGVGSVFFRDEEELLSRSSQDYARCYREEIMPYKQALELWYLEHQSLWVDFKIIILTATALVSPKKALPPKWLKNLPRHELSLPQ